MFRRRNRKKGESDLKRGLIPAGIGGMVLGLHSQLHYLGFVAWEWPALRIVSGIVGGWLLGTATVWVAGKALGGLRLLPKDQSCRSTAWGLLTLSLVSWPVWDALAFRGRLWVLLVFWLFMVVVGNLLFQKIRRSSPEIIQRRRGTILLLLILAWGLFLRFSGLTHGLPDFIVHCDTPKQLALIPAFVQGELEPPGRYPLGHIYLYSGVIRLWKSMIGSQEPVPPLHPETRREFSSYIVVVRGLQALLSAAIPLFIFFFCRDLWGPWVGLLAAFLVACDPIHLTYSRQEMGEVPQFFWVSLSLFFAGRIYSYGRVRDVWWAGFFAGLAVATKMYGGYVVLAALGAVLLSRQRIIKNTGWVFLALIIGLLVGSPYFWLDPSGWWRNTILETIDEFYVRAPTAGGGRTEKILQGLNYLWKGLEHRFHLPWMMMSLWGIFLFFRRLKTKELLFLIPFTASWFLIAFSLTYLREWDLVNLTPYLAMAMAVGLSRIRERWVLASPWRSQVFVWGLTLFLLWQGSIALRDAWLARFPDTRELARKWLIGQADAGTQLFLDTKVTGAHWVPVRSGFQLIGISAEAISKNEIVVSPSKKAWAVVERLWWDPPLTPNLSRLQVFDLRNTYFENPEIYFFDLSAKGAPPEVILPHSRVLPQQPAFGESPRSCQRPLDLLSEPHLQRKQYIFSRRPLPALTYAVLGQGQGSLQFGTALGFPIHSDLKNLSTGSVTPWKRLFPWFPRSYLLSLLPQPGTKGLWVGLFPDPVTVFPLLARSEAWEELEKLARERKKEKDFPAEGRLFYAAALAARNKKAEAEKELVELDRLHPGFQGRYRKLTTAGGELSRVLEVMAGTTGAQLTSADVYWPRRAGDRGELDQKEPPPSVLAEEHLFHLWMPQTFLPSFLEAHLRLRTQGKSEKGGIRLKVISVQANTLVRELVRLELKPGVEEVRIPLEIVGGPVRLEFRMEAEGPMKPEITQLHIQTDYSAEFTWRNRLFQRYLEEKSGS